MVSKVSYPAEISSTSSLNLYIDMNTCGVDVIMGYGGSDEAYEI